MSRRIWQGPLTHITCQYARNLKRYVSHDYNLKHWRLLLLLWVRDEMQGMWTLGVRLTARRARGVRASCGTRGGRVRRAFGTRASGPGSPEAAARAGSMRAAGGGGVQQLGGCAAPRSPRKPALCAAHAPPSSRRRRPDDPTPHTTFQFPLHPRLIYDTFHLIMIFLHIGLPIAFDEF